MDVPFSQVKLQKKTIRSSTPMSRGSESGNEGKVKKGISKPPTPRSRSISQDALAAHNRRMNSPASGGAASRSKATGHDKLD